MLKVSANKEHKINQNSMNDKLLQIIIRLKDEASKNMKALGGVVDEVGNKAKTTASRGFGALNSALAETARFVGGALIGATIATSAAVGGIGVAAIKSASDMQTMAVALETSFAGNVEQAKEAQAQITKFAAKTPYELQEVMTGFIKLKNMGLDPSERAMTAYGNTASAMGKSLNDMVEAVADAATGEFERLKEFGIRASKEGDKVKFTFKGVTSTVGMNSEEIQKYLIGLGETNFAGGMEKQSQTLAGKFSTLKDTVSLALGNLATDVGAVDALGGAMDKASVAVQYLADAASLFVTGDFKGGMFGGALEEDDPIIDTILDLRDAAVALGSWIQQNIPIIIQQLQPFADAFVQRFTMLFEYFTTQLWPILQPILFQLGDLFINHIMPLIVQASLAINDAIQFAMPYITQLIQYAADIIRPIIERLANEVFPLLLPAIQAVLGAFKTILPFIIPILQFFMDRIGTAINFAIDMFNSIVKVVTGVFQILQGVFSGDGEKVKEGFLNIFRGIADAVGGIFKRILNTIIDTINSGIRQVNTLRDRMGDFDIPGVGKLRDKVPSLPEIPKLAVGTNYVPRDMLAYIHKGEAVVPAKYNPAAGGTGGGNIYVTFNVNSGDGGGEEFAEKAWRKIKELAAAENRYAGIGLTI
ncbi:MAG: hypothetical protein OHK0017_07740 [Patescibacteria group bacterium]